MRLLLILPVLILLSCTSAPVDSPDPDQYLDRVRRMHAEYKEQFGYLTSVTLVVTPSTQEPGIPTPTIEEWQQEVLAGMAVRLADLTRVNRFQRDSLAELNAMAVPGEHKDLHGDLVELWEAGIAWTDRWLVATQDAIGGVQGESWGDLDVESDEERAAYEKIHARHVDAWGRVDFVLLGTPQPTPYDIPGSATAWALTPFPDIPTATLGPTPDPTFTPIPIATLVPQRLEITQTYEVRKLSEGEEVSQEEAYYIHFKAWERMAVAATALEECGFSVRKFDPAPHHTPDVVHLWHRALVGLARYEAAGEAVVAVATVLGLDTNNRFTEEDWAAVSPVFVRAVTIEQEYGDSLERLLEAADCPN